MRIQFKFSLLFLLLIQVVLPAGVVLADTGPKPGMDFEFKQELDGEQVTITSGVLYECDQADCSDAIPLEEVGPQGFYCQADRCSATAYGFAPYHRLEIQFSDGQTRQSNIFETAGFDSEYTVTVRTVDLLVEAQFSFGIFPRTGTMILACICGVVGLALIIGLAVFMMRRPRTD
jgi:hypothetical protein